MKLAEERISRARSFFRKVGLAFVLTGIVLLLAGISLEADVVHVAVDQAEIRRGTADGGQLSAGLEGRAFQGDSCHGELASWEVVKDAVRARAVD